MTETSIAEFLRDALSALRVQHGVQFHAVSINLNEHGQFISIHAHGECEFGDTLVTAAKALVAKIGTPERLAEAKRAKAKQLMAEADQLSPVSTP